MSERLNRRAEGSPKANIAELKTSVYLGSEMAAVRECAARLDRSVSWVLARAWRIAKAELNSLPTVSENDPQETTTDHTGE